MPNARDISANPTPSILLIGDGGTRKTRFLAGCPKPFIYDFDKGMLSTRTMPQVKAGEVEYETFKDAPHGSKAIDKDNGIYPWGESYMRFLDHLNNQMWPRIEAGTIPYLTLGVDSLTTLATQCMNYVLKSNGKTGSANPEVQHWGQQLRLLETLMEQLAVWPINLVVTAHIKRDDNLVNNVTEYLPLVAGQLSGKIGIYFDEVWFTEPKGMGDSQKIVLRTQAGGLHKQAKSRNNVKNETEATWEHVNKFFKAA